MGVPHKVSLSLFAATPTGVATAQSRASAGPLVLNGSLATAGVATFDTARRVGITSVGNNSGITFTITGKDRSGNKLVEVLGGTSASTAQSQYDFASVSSIVTSGATAGNVSAGTTTVASTEWRVVDQFSDAFNLGIGVSFLGSANVTIEYTFDDPNAALAGSFEPNSFIPPMPWPMPNMTTITQQTADAFNVPVFAVRMTMNSGAGVATMQLIQVGSKN